MHKTLSSSVSTQKWTFPRYTGRKTGGTLRCDCTEREGGPSDALPVAPVGGAHGGRPVDGVEVARRVVRRVREADGGPDTGPCVSVITEGHGRVDHTRLAFPLVPSLYAPPLYSSVLGVYARREDPIVLKRYPYTHTHVRRVCVRK